ncbi:MAG: membrane or secreted protein [Chitinophagaceae bacterium]|nr:membrane or secreted protein [Chitinophagaceae bacterium]
MKGFLVFILSSVFLFLNSTVPAQNRSNKNLVYVDKQGVLRWTKDKKEACFFGVNYTTPFAHAYRAHRALGVDVEKAIQQDVYHFARLGLDAFRVHVWDTEISDTLGNLLENEHLRLLDFLLAELKKRNIKTVITPIAFWGNGYPERDELTPGFSRKYGKGRATTNDTAIVAQENYLKQFFKHVNPYTKSTYVGDPDIIAVEINNEPSHSGSKAGVTNYINKLAAAIKSVGWTKPVYYNIAQNPFYADAVAKANIDGVSFQWYPSGLVANQEVKGNFLPNADHYQIPFDTIPEYRNKSKMVYEFDAADILQSYMYPAMAKSFREAGFQWATQFAYDPTAMANVNTEYQTHYLNLLYTPSKAVSLLIASKIFHKVPRLKNWGTYPADSSFDVFRVSYKNALSEMNTADEFYYSNSTTTTPTNLSKLQHIAGVGNSPVVLYSGSGAYFLDKISDGVWRLEVMPDAIQIRDPFERASPRKEVTRLEWSSNAMQVLVPDLASGFSIKALNRGNNFSPSVAGNSFQIQPGTYLLNATEKSNAANSIGVIGMNEFGATNSTASGMFLRHEPFEEVSPEKPLLISTKIVGLDTGRANLQIITLDGRGGGFRNLPMVKKSGEYVAEIPADLATPGMLHYRIILQKGNWFAVFPGNYKESPFAWDNYNNETYKTFVAANNGRLNIFNPTVDKTAKVYPVFRRGFQTSYITGEISGQLILRLSATELSGDHTIGFVHYFGDKLVGRKPEIDSFNRLVVRAKTSETRPIKAKITLTNKDAFSFSTFINLNNTFQDLEVPINNLAQDSALLLPRPYPGFLPLWFKGSGIASFALADMERIQVSVGSELHESEFKKPYSLEVESIWLEKRK